MRIAEWNNPDIGIRELMDFYHIDESSLPDDRPYTWYMVVHSGGIIKLDDESRPQDIALAHIRESVPAAAGAAADWKALQFGWAYADAVLGGAEIPRAEPDVMWNVEIKDFMDFRSGLKRDYSQPIKVVLTRRAEPDKFNLSHPVFHQDKAIIFTSEIGEKSIYSQLDSMARRPKGLEVYALGKESVEDYKEMMRILRQDFNVRYLDVQGGGQTAGQLLKAKLLDEYRETQPPTEFGAVYADGKPRPHVFGGVNFNKDNSPVWRDTRVGLAANHVLIRRSNPLYRH